MEQKTEASQAVDERAEMIEALRACVIALEHAGIGSRTRGIAQTNAADVLARAALKAQPAPTEAAQGEDSARLDAVVEANRALLHERSQLGIKKYGGTLGEKQYPHRELLTHALLEALDLSNYLQAAIMGIDRASAETGGVES